MTDGPAVVRCSVGIGVSKDALDIFIYSSAEVFRVRNQADDIAALVERPRVVAPDHIVVEASGGFESAGWRRLIGRTPTERAQHLLGEELVVEAVVTQEAVGAC